MKTLHKLHYSWEGIKRYERLHKLIMCSLELVLKSTDWVKGTLSKAGSGEQWPGVQLVFKIAIL